MSSASVPRCESPILSGDDDDTVEESYMAEDKEVVENIATHFRLPLEARGISIVILQGEVEEIVECAQTYLDIN